MATELQAANSGTSARVKPMSTQPPSLFKVWVYCGTAAAAAAFLLRSYRFWVYGVAPAAFSALLLWLCFFPVAIGWFGWIALVPLLCLVRSNLRPAEIYWAAWIGGLCFFWPVLQWMRVADYRMFYTWAMLATYCACYFPAAIYLVRLVDKLGFMPLVLSVSCVWVGLEYVRSFLLSGFTWYFLGHTQHDFLPIIQIADTAGVYGVSFLVAAANAWVFALLVQWPRFRDFVHLKEGHDYWIAPQGIALLLVLAATFAYGLHRLGQNQFERGPRVALLQGNLDQRLRNEAYDPKSPRNLREEILRHYLHLSHFAVRSQHVRPDLLVWPETSFPAQWREISEKVDLVEVPVEAQYTANIQRDVQGLALLVNEEAAEKRTATLLGVNTTYINDQRQRVLYNSALLLNDSGNWGPRYDKMHRIPFGEYVPLAWLPFMKDLMPYDFDYSITSGTAFTRFPLGDYTFGVLICYEDTDPFLARRYAVANKDGKAVNFLINISNDGWFDGTSEHDQHLAISRFRAVECRRALARAVNMGISAVIDSNGRVLKPNVIEQSEFPQPKSSDDGVKSPGEVLYSWFDRGAEAEDLPVSEWRDYKKAAGVMAMNMPIDNRTSYYGLWGDWLPWLCWTLMGGAMLWSFGVARKLGDKSRNPKQFRSTK